MSVTCRAGLIGSASCSAIDHDIRFAMIKAAELTTSADLERGASLVAPKLTIKDIKGKEPTAPEPAPLKTPKLSDDKEKKKKKKPVPKWQENGLTDSDKKAIDAALAKLVSPMMSLAGADCSWHTGRIISSPTRSTSQISQSE